MHNDAPPVSAAALPPAAAGPPGPSAANTPIAGAPSQHQDDDAAVTVSTSNESRSCCSSVYAHRMADFKRHPTASATRQQRMELNTSLRSQAREELLRQLREKAELQLQQEQERLQQQEGNQRTVQQSKKSSGHRRSGHYVKAPEECLDSRRLRQLLVHPQHIVDVPEELQSGEFMVALRPEGRTCLLLLRNGKGHLYDKKEKAVFRVQCTRNAQTAAACSGPSSYGCHLTQPDAQYRLPMQPEEMQQLQDDEALFLPPEEKQRLLLQRARSFDVSLYGSQETADSRETEMHLEEAPLSSLQSPEEPCAADAPYGTDAFLKQQQQQRPQQRGRKQQRQSGPPLLCLPEGILSKGLTLLECVLCPYTPANTQYFSRQYAAQEGDAAAAAAAAAAAGRGAARPWNSKEEKPMWQVLFIVDVLFLGGVMLGHCEFECRHFFLKSRIEESPASFAPLQLLPYLEASASYLHLLFSGPFLYPPDGFFFQHKLAPHVGGPNPFALYWRDERIARFPIDEKNLGQPYIDTFLLFRADGQIYSDEGICVAEVNPEEFGIAALPEPRVMHCWIADLDMNTGRFLTVKKPPQDGHDTFRGEQMSVEPPLTSPGISAERLVTNQQGEECVYEDTEGQIGIDAKEAGPAAMKTCGRQQLRGGGPRRLHHRQQRDRAADSHSKLVDQWLRMKGSHPVNITVLSNNCPP